MKIIRCLLKLVFIASLILRIFLHSTEQYIHKPSANYTIQNIHSKITQNYTFIGSLSIRFNVFNTRAIVLKGTKQDSIVPSIYDDWLAYYGSQSELAKLAIIVNCRNELQNKHRNFATNIPNAN